MMPERDDAALAGLARLLREHATASVPPELDQSGKLALTRRLRNEASREPRRVRPSFALGGAVALAAVVALLVLRLRPLAYEVRGARSDGPYISAPATTPVTVAFADGSAIEAAPGARLRVDEPRATGARVLVERGRASVHVQHRTGSAWNFVAGPFDVHVTGTRFELSWDPSGEAMDLSLYEGSVEVRGPFAEAPIAVRAGQRFRAEVATRRRRSPRPPTTRKQKNRRPPR
jgi:transmembrane sensor